MKLGFTIARLSPKLCAAAEPAQAPAQPTCEEPAYAMLNEQTWTAVFSWLSTADLARSRVSTTHALVIGCVYGNGKRSMLTTGGLLRMERLDRLSTSMTMPCSSCSREPSETIPVISLLQIRRGIFQKHWLLANVEDQPRHPSFYLV